MILQAIQEKHKASNGKCGISIVSLIAITGKPYAEVHNEIQNLVKLEKVKVRPGINRKLFFLNQKL